MGAALGLGALAASSLVIGALVGLARDWPDRLIGLVLAFGAGALISAVSFELAEEGAVVGGAGPVAIGLGVGALTYYFLNNAVSGRPGMSVQGRSEAADSGRALALGAFLDGIPEQLVLGIGIALGEGVSIGLLVAIFVSNLPEAIGGASEMRAAGTRPGAIRRLWIVVAAICALASVGGYALADVASDELKAAINGFAAGALLVMLADSMIPDATRKAGAQSGLVLVLGFAVAAAMSGLH
jgi:ZIP family zinc transporter